MHGVVYGYLIREFGIRYSDDNSLPVAVELKERLGECVLCGVWSFKTTGWFYKNLNLFSSTV